MFYSSFRINLQIKSSEKETSRPHSVRAGEFPGHLISISSDDVKNDLFLSEIIAEVINLFTIVFCIYFLCIYVFKCIVIRNLPRSHAKFVFVKESI